MASFEIDFGPDGGGSIKFVDRADFNKFLEGEIQEWGRVFAKSDGSYPNALAAVREIWQHILNTSFQYASENQLSEIHRQVREFVRNKTLVSASSIEGKKLAEVLTGTNELGFYGAWTFRLGNSIGSLQSGSDKGAILYLMLSLGMHPKTQKLSESAIRATITKLSELSQSFNNDLESRIADLGAETNNLVENFVGFLANSQEDVREIKEDYASTRKAQKAEFDSLTGSSKIEIDRLTAQFKEKMRLEAPALYWAKKAKRHGELHQYLGIATGIFATVFACATWFFGPAIASHASLLVSTLVTDLPSLTRTTEGQKFVATLRLASVGLTAILLSTLAIWTLRYLVRMMISENHLKADAETREVMISTYLALIKESGTTEKEDRHIILSSIFTPPTDGLLKDDGLPVATQLGMLAGRTGPQ